MEKPEELKVFITNRESVCDVCKEQLGSGAWITLREGIGAVCLTCADLDQLDFLEAGDAALSRRSKKYSPIYAVVLKWSRARKRYERQGLLVTEDATSRAEEECLQDADLRERRREREAERRAELDQAFVSEFPKRIRMLYPGLPHKREQIVAEHACRKYTGRVGRSAAAKSFDEKAIGLAVVAHIRHTLTNYDLLLSKGRDRYEARDMVRGTVYEVLQSWEKPKN